MLEGLAEVVMEGGGAAQKMLCWSRSQDSIGPAGLAFDSKWDDSCD